MVGAIADWFAVIALFKHPLGLPVPHTALIPTPQGRCSVAAWRSSSARTSCRRRSSGAGPRRRARRRVGEWLGAGGERAPAWSDEAAALLHARALERIRDEDVADLVDTVLVPRFLEEPISPLAGSLLQEIVEDGAHHGLVDLAARGGPPLADRQRGHVRRRSSASGRRGGRRTRSTSGSPTGCTPRSSRGSRTSAATRTTTPGIALDDAAAPSSPTTCCTTRRPRSGWSGSRSGSSATRRSSVTGHLAVERAAARAAGGARRRDGPLRTRARRRGRRLRRAAAARRRRCAPGSTSGPPTSRSSSSTATARELTAVITHTIDQWDGKEAAAQDRAARRQGPAVHPDQRHHRRRPRRRDHPRRRGAGLGMPTMTSDRRLATCRSATSRSGSASSSSSPTSSTPARTPRPLLAEGPASRSTARSRPGAVGSSRKGDVGRPSADGTVAGRLTPALGSADVDAGRRRRSGSRRA